VGARAIALHGGESKSSFLALDRAPPRVEELTHTVLQDQIKAKIASLNARTDAALARQKEEVAEGNALRYKAEKMKYVTEAQTEGIEYSLENAKENANVAITNAKKASTILENTKKDVATQLEATKGLAHDAVLANLRKMYSELNEWKKKVLRDPYKEAQKAGAKAAEPYHKMISTLNSRITEYQVTARAMSDKANALANGAQDLAAQAGGKQSNGDAIGANQDLMTAQAMAAESQQLSGNAAALQGQASAMNKTIGDYLAHGHMAAWAAMYKVDPDGLPPPPRNPDASIPPY